MSNEAVKLYHLLVAQTNYCVWAASELQYNNNSNGCYRKKVANLFNQWCMQCIPLRLKNSSLEYFQIHDQNDLFKSISIYLLYIKADESIFRFGQHLFERFINTTASKSIFSIYKSIYLSKQNNIF